MHKTKLIGRNCLPFRFHEIATLALAMTKFLSCARNEIIDNYQIIRYQIIRVILSVVEESSVAKMRLAAGCFGRLNLTGEGGTPTPETKARSGCT